MVCSGCSPIARAGVRYFTFSPLLRICLRDGEKQHENPLDDDGEITYNQKEIIQPEVYVTGQEKVGVEHGMSLL
jgi:hypothetical protein